MCLELTWRPFTVEKSKFFIYKVQNLFKIISILKCFSLNRNAILCQPWSVFLSFLYHILRRTSRKFNGKSIAVWIVPTDFRMLKSAKCSLHLSNWMHLCTESIYGLRRGGYISHTVPEILKRPTRVLAQWRSVLKIHFCTDIRRLRLVYKNSYTDPAYTGGKLIRNISNYLSIDAVSYVTGPEYLQQQHPEYLTIRTFLFCHKLPCNGEIKELTGSLSNTT